MLYKDISIRKAELRRDIVNLISYAVGCMFGRYSLDENGLIYAGGEWNISRYISFRPDMNNVMPITDEVYFDEDIVDKFCQWISVVYGEETMEENLDFIASALGNKGDTSREVIRNYFLKDFMTDHLKIYQKCPIYWLFDSGKEDGFKALIYMHRYNPDTVGIVRTDYLHKTQRAVEQMSQEIGIDNRFKEHMSQYGNFWKNKVRIERFKALGIDHFNVETIDIGLIAVLTDVKTPNFEEVVKQMLLNDAADYIKALENNNLLERFWQLCNKSFGYDAENPSLDDLAAYMVVTYAASELKSSVPAVMKNYVLKKKNDVVVFVRNIMDNVLYQEIYAQILFLVIRF